MSLPIVFRLEAQTEFDEAIDWYEQQAELGLEFLDCVADTLTRIQAMPESYESLIIRLQRNDIVLLVNLQRLFASTEPYRSTALIVGRDGSRGC